MKLYDKAIWHDYGNDQASITFKSHEYSYKTYEDALKWRSSIEYDAFQFDNIIDLRSFLVEKLSDGLLIRAVKNIEDAKYNPLNNWESSINYASTGFISDQIAVSGKMETVIKKVIHISDISDKVTQENIKRFLFLINPGIKSEPSEKQILEANGQTDFFKETV